jgi:hypothetical protein
VLFTITPFPQRTYPFHCSAGNWLCFARLLPRAAVGRPRIGFVLHNRPRVWPARGIGFVLPNRSLAKARGRTLTARAARPQLFCIQSAIRNSTRPRPHDSSFRFQIVNPRGSASGQTVPLYRGRVARIGPEFWASTTLETRVTPCPRRNKEFLTCRVFCPVNCCTNGARKAGSGGGRLEAGGSPRASLGSQTPFIAFGSRSPLARAPHSTAGDAEGRRGKRTKNRFRAETPGRRGREGRRQSTEG